MGGREALFRLALRALAASFAVVGALFLLAPDATLRALERAGALFGDFAPAPTSELRLWLVLAVSYMVLVTLLAWMAQRDLRRYRHLLAILVAGKTSSSLLALLFYWVSADVFAYLLNFLVDGAIALGVLGIWAAVPGLGPGSPAGAEGGAGSPRRERPLAGRGALRALLEALAPEGGPFPEGAVALGLAEPVGEFLAGSRATRSVRPLLALLEVSPLFLPPIWLRRFSRLPLADRVRVLEAWEASRWWPRRQALHLLKLVALSHFYAQPAVQARLGHPPPLERVPVADLPRPDPRPAGISPDDLPGSLAERAEVVVVGTGAGGAVAAAELAEAGLDVLLLEEGDHYGRRDFTARPLEQLRHLYRDRGLTGTLGNTFIPVPLGCAVGGTTTINSGTCWRAPEEVLERWEREFGIPHLARGGLDPEYECVEKAIGVAPVPESLLGPGALLFRRGAEALGLHGEPIPRNAVGCRGTGVCVFGCPRDAKQSTNLSYVPRALAAGARLHVRARVERVLVEGGRAVGVLATRLGRRREPVGTLRVEAPVVVVAAGALLTPALLARSGLARRGSGVGRHLRLHPASRVLARFDEPVRAWEGVPQSFQVRDFEGEGIVLQGMWVPPEIQAPAVPGVGPAHKERMGAYERMASFGVLISDVSSGRVLTLGARALPWYRLEAGDVRRLLRGISLAARVFFAAGAREVYAGVRQRPVLPSAAEAEALEHFPARAADLELMAFHPMGTARMGGDPRRSAVDPDGRLRGASGVLVADASLFPTSTRVNPQLTIMALATRIARGLAGRTAPP